MKLVINTMKYIIVITILLFSISSLAEEGKNNHGIVYIKGEAKYLDWNSFHNIKATPEYKKNKSNHKYGYKNISIMLWKHIDYKYIFEILIHKYDIETQKNIIRMEKYRYKIDNNNMFINKSLHAYDHGYIIKPYWDKIHIEVKGMRRIPEFNNREYMIVFLKSGFFEGEFAIIEN